MFPGGLYHVITRGNDRQHVFLDDDDFAAFRGVMGRVIDRFSWLCHTYCLMNNHYHLLIETPKPNLPDGMRQLNGVYAQGFNGRHGRCGHLFQARYRSILVEKDTHLLEVARYIVLNPIRAGIWDHPSDYRWSSYRAIAGLEEAAPFLTTETVLSSFGRRRRQAQAAYRSFVDSGLSAAMDVRGERVGTEPFLRDRHGIDPPIAEIKREQIEPVRRPLEDLFAESSYPIHAAYRVHGYALREIAEYLGCHYSTVSRRLREQEAEVACKT